MKARIKSNGAGISRRDSLKLVPLALGGLAFADTRSSDSCANAPACAWSTGPETQRYSYFESLTPFNPWDPNDPNTALAADEMRITFLGSAIPPMRRAQQNMSIFVEVGPWIYNPDHPGDPTWGRATDQFVFDCGSGVCSNFGAMNIGYGRMDKIFLVHLHPDHMSDLGCIYAFGISSDRQSPLYVWGPGPSGVRSPDGRLYNDGTRACCKHLRTALRWATESFAFQYSSYSGYQRPTQASWGLPCPPVPVDDDPPDDGYALIPIELDWRKYSLDGSNNVAYDNQATGVKITHFPVIHTRQGSMGYKLEWNGLSLIYTGDTKPEKLSIEQAVNQGKGLDVFIHEMIVPPQVWAMKMGGSDVLPDFSAPGVQQVKTVQDSSHTPQGAYGYLLSQIKPRPRLAVATHFPVADDTVACALESVKAHNPGIQMGRDIIWSFDLMVLKVSKSRIQQLRAVVPDFGFSPWVQPHANLNPPKYHDASGAGDPFAQIDTTQQIQAGPDTYCETGF